jgi:hypothetical protein
VREYEDFAWTAPWQLRQRAQDTALWDLYRQTEVRFDTPELVGCVRPVDEDGSDLPPLGSVHVISATQPDSDPTSEDTVLRLALLDHELRQNGVRTIPAVGASFSGDYREPSRAIFGVDEIFARALGVRFGQVAIFSWRGTKWSLLACAADQQDDRPWQWTAGVR